MSELLVSRQGPLAHVWLASNYDKKLSKQQFLNTNIVSSSNLISTRQVQPASDAGSDTITLRLSGQLLLGIVRIYSRKTKYLLDDIHETLYKLKNSFKLASGASLGSSVASTVNLPPQRTTISNMARITLQDQVTDHDLFYQEDLVLDEPSEPIRGTDALSQVSVRGLDDADRSIEYPRANDMPDIDLDLDFDLDLDNSIEQGRDAVPALSDAEQSLLDIVPKPTEQPDMSFDLGEPLETIAERNSDTYGPHEAQTPPSTAPRERRSAVGFTDSGVIKTAKRRLVVDSAEDLERGLPNEVLRNIQNYQNSGRFADETLTLRLSLQEKLELIQELAAPVSSKRRKIWNLDDQLRQRCLDLSNEEEVQPDTTMDQSVDFNLDTNIDFDLSLPELEPQGTPEPAQEDILEAEDSIDSTNENPQSTMQVAEHLRNAFYEEPHIYLGDLMAKDMENPHNRPLGTTSQTGSSVKVSERREATKCFFELLVLASNDCVTLEQNEPLDPTHIPSDVVVRPRDNLVSMYV